MFFVWIIVGLIFGYVTKGEPNALEAFLFLCFTIACCLIESKNKNN